MSEQRLVFKTDAETISKMEKYYESIRKLVEHNRNEQQIARNRLAGASRR